MTMTFNPRSALAREERATHGLELREADDGSLTFSGTASTVGQAYEVNDLFGTFSETMDVGAFDQTIQRGDVRLLVNHQGVPLARTKSGTLTLRADPHLRADAKLDPANPTVTEVRSAMGRGDLDAMSIGFRVIRDDWSKDGSERVIRELKLFDVSIVSFPANPHTSASLRSLLTSDLDGPEQIRAAITQLHRMLPPDEKPYDPDLYDRLDRYWRQREVDPLSIERPHRR